MKRRGRGGNESDREQLEREALAELQRGTGGQAGPRPTARSGGGDRPRAWGAANPQPAWTPSAPEPEPEDEAEWRPSRQASGAARPARARPVRSLEEQAEAELLGYEDELEDEEEAWDEDDGGGHPIGLLGVPLDYDATGIALEQLAQRSNIARPADMVMGVDALEAESIRDRAMAQFLEKQKVMARADAERAAERAAAAGTTAVPVKRAAFPPLSPGLSAKSLVMQPVSAPPLHLPGASTPSDEANTPGATTISPALTGMRAKAEREAASEAEADVRATRRRSSAAAPATSGKATKTTGKAAKTPGKAAKVAGKTATTAKTAKAAKTTKAAGRMAVPSVPSVAAAKATKKPASARAGSVSAGATRAGTAKVAPAAKAGRPTKATATPTEATPSTKGSAAKKVVARKRAAPAEQSARTEVGEVAPKRTVTKKAATKKAVTKKAAAGAPKASAGAEAKSTGAGTARRVVVSRRGAAARR